MGKRLRSGYTTGACAAAAAKAAALFLKEGVEPKEVSLVFPDGSTHSFIVHRLEKQGDSIFASVIKDAGDDPDVTNGAEIKACVDLQGKKSPVDNAVLIDTIELAGGSGVGRVTKPGLAVKVGEPAINPIPRQMICAAVKEVLADEGVRVEISIVRGLELAEKTLNKRLGIVDGLSVLGTTGIVRPISADAWTATIEASMDVAKEAGLTEVVLSTGRTSEKGVQSILNLSEEAYAMMGDYLYFSLEKAAEKGFTRIHLSGMWAKIMKAALRVPQTHVRNGALEMTDAAGLLAELGVEGQLLQHIQGANTAREMYEHLAGEKRGDVILAVCKRARAYAQEVSGKEVRLYLVNSKAEVVERV